MSEKNASTAAAASPVVSSQVVRFVEDQVEATRVLREEKIGEERDAAFQRRPDACHLAMRYFDTFTAGETPSVARVIEVAREFERFLLQP